MKSLIQKTKCYEIQRKLFCLQDRPKINRVQMQVNMGKEKNVNTLENWSDARKMGTRNYLYIKTIIMSKKQEVEK